MLFAIPAVLFSLAIPVMAREKPPLCPPEATEWVRVTGVPAPDRLRLEDGREIQLAGIAVALPRQAEQSRKALAILAQGQRLALHPLGKTDRWGRIFAHPVLADGRSLEAVLVEQGHAHVAALSPSSCTAALLQHEATARAAHLGLWRNKGYVREAHTGEKLVSSIGHHIIISGVVVSARIFGNRMYMNFAQKWHSALSLTVSLKDAKALGLPVEQPASLVGQHIDARGFLEWGRGPVIALSPMEPFRRSAATPLDGGTR